MKMADPQTSENGQAPAPSLTNIQYQILTWICPDSPEHRCAGSAYEGKSKLGVLLGPEFAGKIAGKTVIDFGCGEGSESLEMSRLGAKRVIGLDIREDIFARARSRAKQLRLACEFATSTTEKADVIVSLDAFEHFADPAEILNIMHSLLRSGGEALISFGPTWYHPLGGHLFSVFPWAHVVFSEAALIRWRSRFKTDGARKFGEVAGGLNQMTIGRFEKLIAASPFVVAGLETVPIRKLRRFHNRLTREFTTSIVRCHLQKKNQGTISR